jgi:hypothetical protein
MRRVIAGTSTPLPSRRLSTKPTVVTDEPSPCATTARKG